MSVLFWLFVLILVLFPVFKQRQLELARLRLVRKFETQRGSRLITVIHRQEAITIFGVPISRYISIEDSEQILRAIRLTPEDMPIDILLHTPGGLVLAAEQIAHAIGRHPAPVTVYVPHYAMSGGTLVALAADEIVMDENAVLGPVDPQLGQYPAASILKAVSQKTLDEVDDETLIMQDIAQKAVAQVRDLLLEILGEKMEEEQAQHVAAQLAEGRWTHDYPITCEKLSALGVPVCGELPEELYTLMDYYPQPAQRRPSVQYVPVPYHPQRPSDGR